MRRPRRPLALQRSTAEGIAEWWPGLLVMWASQWAGGRAARLAPPLSPVRRSRTPLLRPSRPRALHTLPSCQPHPPPRKASSSGNSPLTAAPPWRHQDRCPRGNYPLAFEPSWPTRAPGGWWLGSMGVPSMGFPEVLAHGGGDAGSPSLQRKNACALLPSGSIRRGCTTGAPYRESRLSIRRKLVGGLAGHSIMRHWFLRSASGSPTGILDRRCGIIRCNPPDLGYSVLDAGTGRLPVVIAGVHRSYVTAPYARAQANTSTEVPETTLFVFPGLPWPMAHGDTRRTGEQTPAILGYCSLFSRIVGTSLHPGGIQTVRRGKRGG